MGCIKITSPVTTPVPWGFFFFFWIAIDLPFKMIIYTLRSVFRLPGGQTRIGKDSASDTCSLRQPKQIMPFDGGLKSGIHDLMQSSSLEISFLILFHICP